LIRLARDISDAASSQLLARSTMTVLCRADGGFGGPVTEVPPPRPHPGRLPDCTVTMATLPQQALIYRLSGDVNPLHADPAAARKAGFERPILHGLATFGFVGRALTQAAGEAGQGDDLRTLRGRFLAPVFPGDTLAVDLWQEEDGWTVRASVPARDTVVFANGFARLQPSSRS
jgi:acyl dehydratase